MHEKFAFRELYILTIKTRVFNKYLRNEIFSVIKLSICSNTWQTQKTNTQKYYENEGEILIFLLQIYTK